MSYIRRENPWPWELFEAGVRACGDEIVDPPRPGCDIVVSWNNYGVRGRLTGAMARAGARHILKKNGNIPGTDYLGFDGFNGRGSWNAPFEGPPTRWDGFGIEIKPMSPGEHILVCGQRGGRYSDMSMPVHWPDEIIARLLRATDRKIRYRMHPERKRRLKFAQNDRDADRVSTSDPAFTPLGVDMEDAHAVVVWTSSVATLAWLEGIQVRYEGPTILSAYFSKRISDDIDDHPEFNRRSVVPGVDPRPVFAQTIAWCHWRPEEIKDGTAWRWMTRERI